MANKYIFNSPFKSDIQKFLDLKHSLGYKYALEEILLSQFDKMCIFKYSKEKVLTRIIAMDWATARKNESNSSLGNRIVTIREFAKYLNNTGKYAFVIPTTYIPKKKKYQSYIYTNYELQKIFDIIDNKKFNCRYKNCYIVYPVLFRILYCCGLRISEALHLKVKDVDLQNGIIYVYESKNNTDRLVPISEELKNICTEYFNKLHLSSDKNDFFFFTKDSQTQIGQSAIHTSFRKILALAGIEKSKLNNPRIHDFRHTFAINCLKKFISENKDLNAYLPILKTYMGHSKFKSTEYYLKLTNDMFPDILLRFNSYIEDAIPNIGGECYEK